MKIVISIFYLLGVGSVIVFGFLSCFNRDKALKIARIWSGLVQIQLPARDEEMVERMVPPRPIGLLLLLGGLFMPLRPIMWMFENKTIPTVEPTALPISHSHITSWFSVFIPLCFVAISVYMLIDPIGLFCLFARKDRTQYPKKYKRGWPVIALSVSLIIASTYTLFRVIGY